MKKANILWVIGIMGSIMLFSRKNAEATKPIVQKHSPSKEDDRKFFRMIIDNMAIRRSTDPNILILRQIKPDLEMDMMTYSLVNGNFKQTLEFSKSMYSYNVVDIELNARANAFSLEELNTYMLSKI